MRREVVYRGMDAAPKRVIDALDRATERLERVVARFDPRTAFLRVVVATHPTRTRHTVSIRLTLRGAVLHAREERPTPVAAIKDSFKDLREQFQRHAGQLRPKHQRDRAVPPAILVEELAIKAAHELQVLDPLNAEQIARLQRFVQREVFYRRLDGRLPYGISVDAIVDETVVLALEEADEKPAWLSYEAWLLQLAQRTVGRRSISSANTLGNGSQDPHVEWEASAAGLLDPPMDDDWLSYFQPDDNASVGDVTADTSIVSPEDHLARRELQAHVHRILADLPHAWRHAFTLCTIEGFNASDAASSLDSSSDEVRHQVVLATEFLRQKLRETGYRNEVSAKAG